MKSSRSASRVLALSLSTGLVLVACSRSGDDLAEPSASTLGTTTTAAPADDAGSDAPADDETPTTTVAVQEGVTSTTFTVTLPSTVPPVSVVEVAEVGVPGLDSDDAFCASWSRFAGSFQVVAVTAAFGSGPPEQLASLEVAAAPTVTEAYDQLVTVWPDELSSEADLVADEFLGPFARRLDAARDALDAAGADADTIDRISEAWLAGLAQRDPTTPEFVVDLPDDVWAVIDEAADDFQSQRVPFASDPSLVTNVETPLTSEYLAVSCPDQGTLSGQEVETP